MQDGGGNPASYPMRESRQVFTNTTHVIPASTHVIPAQAGMTDGGVGVIFFFCLRAPHG